MASERIAKHRAAVLRPILELEKRGEPISAAIGDAAWELGLAKSHTWSLYRRLRENDANRQALLARADAIWTRSSGVKS